MRATVAIMRGILGPFKVAEIDIDPRTLRYDEVVRLLLIVRANGHLRKLDSTNCERVRS